MVRAQIYTDVSLDSSHFVVCKCFDSEDRWFFIFYFWIFQLIEACLVAQINQNLTPKIWIITQLLRLKILLPECCWNLLLTMVLKAGFKTDVRAGSLLCRWGWLMWYGRRVNGSKQMVSEHRTPLMVAAATYGSLDDVLELSLYCCSLPLM